MTVGEYWNKLNKMYGLELEIPEEIKIDPKAVEYEMAMGKSFDSAVQNKMR